jgi:hypothetical protein
VVEKMVRGGRNGREIEKEWLGQENDGKSRYEDQSLGYDHVEIMETITLDTC